MPHLIMMVLLDVGQVTRSDSTSRLMLYAQNAVFKPAWVLLVGQNPLNDNPSPGAV